MAGRHRFAAGAIAATLACGQYQAPPVPVVGTAADISRLAGRWVGEYGSVETGRSGSILFALAAGTDTATGDVVMGPLATVRAAPDERLPGVRAQQTGAGQTLAIRFVRAAHDTVSGSLEPYNDPECGCPVRTTFVGALRADTLEGTYVIRHVTGGAAPRSGRWRAVREK